MLQRVGRMDFAFDTSRLVDKFQYMGELEAYLPEDDDDVSVHKVDLEVKQTTAGPSRLTVVGVSEVAGGQDSSLAQHTCTSTASSD